MIYDQIFLDEMKGADCIDTELTTLRNWYPDQMRELRLPYLYDSIALRESLECLDEAVKQNTKAKSFFDSLGIEYDKIISRVKQCGSDIAKAIKSIGVNDKSKMTISKAISSMNKDIAEYMTITDSPALENIFGTGYDLNKVRKAISLTLRVIIANTIVANALVLLFGMGGYILAVAVVAPIFEEFSKNIATKGKFAAEFAIVFNLCELSMYVSKGVGVATRIVVAGVLHGTNAIIHFITSDEKVQKALKVKPEDSDKVSFIGQTVATLYHIIWNSLAVVAALK